MKKKQKRDKNKSKVKNNERYTILFDVDEEVITVQNSNGREIVRESGLSAKVDFAEQKIIVIKKNGKTKIFDFNGNRIMEYKYKGNEIIVIRY